MPVNGKHTQGNGKGTPPRWETVLVKYRMVIITACAVLVFLLTLALLFNMMPQKSPLAEASPSPIVLMPESTPVPSASTESTPTPEPTPAAEPLAALGLRAYIVIPGTNIDYPVMLYSDNETYLEQDINGKKDVSGSICMDYRNQYPSRRRNIIIFGHNMKDKGMFATLHNFEQKKFFSEHSYVELELFGVKYEYEVVYAGMINSEEYYFISTKFDTDQAFVDYFTEGTRYAQFVREGYVPSAEDQMLTLFTCVSRSISNKDDKRMVVVARRVRELGPAERTTMEYAQSASQADMAG